MERAEVFILTDSWHDSHGKNILRYQGTSEELGPVEVIFNDVKPVFFVPGKIILPDLGVKYSSKKVNLKYLDNTPVDALYFDTQKDLLTAADKIKSLGIPVYESDVDPSRRFLMERFINAQMEVSGNAVRYKNYTRFINPRIKPCTVEPDLKVMSLDIETGVKSNRLYSIAADVTGKGKNIQRVFMLGKRDRNAPAYLSFNSEESDLLKEFIDWFKGIDPDVIIGWHVIGFDLMFIESKCREFHIPFDIARGEGNVTLRSRRNGNYFANIPGRIVIDGPPALRMSFYSFEDYKLETVAQALLGTGKTITPEEDKIEEIERQFRDDKLSLAEYNLQDAVLVSSIFKKTGLLKLSITRIKLSGLLIDRLGMMTAAFDHFYLPRLHRQGFVAGNIGDLKNTSHAAGGYVLDPKPGIYDDVVVLDFKSLYPSIIQTFKIDPLSRVLSKENTILTPNGIKFSFSRHILPDFIKQLMELRGKAKKDGDKHLSQAIKILMNSFYGVMGSFGCRFYHPDLPTAITGTGQWLLLSSKEFLTGLGYNVVYGDTDSLFVQLKKGEGKKADYNGEYLARKVNDYWKERLSADFSVDSHLEMEYEKYYKKFIITLARGSESGAKKRYAGLLLKDGKETLDFVGMEIVRSDWTRLAKEFQVELYKRVFSGVDITGWIKRFVNDVKQGNFDDKLVYRKRLRKDIDEYVKNIPPQVKAAKMLNTSSNIVYYVITKRGPVPVELKHDDIDYKHYIDKQLKPIADSVLALIGESFDNIVQSDQLSFF